MTYPFDIDGDYISVFYQDGDHPFICGSWGLPPSADLDQELLDSDIDVLFDKGDGEYFYRVSYSDAQMDELGRVEQEGYFEFNFIKFIGLIEN